jgi:ribosomal protein S12 methylthiotransferase accessory factor
MEFTVTFEGKKKVIAHIGEHKIITDQPVMAGGDDSAPAPFSLFLASLGTCAGIYVKSFCDQRGIDTDGIKIVQKHSFNPMTHMIENLTIDIKLPMSFPEKYKDAVIKVAEQCAVKKHLQNPPSMIVTTSSN